MKAALGSWPIASAFLTAVVVAAVPFSPPASVVIAVLTVFWATATVHLQPDWSDVAGSVRVLHLSSGALLVSSFFLLVSVHLTNVSGTTLIQATLILAGPLNLFVGYSLLQVARHGSNRFRREDILDTAAHVSLPLSLVAATAWPTFSMAEISIESQLTIVAISALASFIFAAGVMVIIGRPPGAQPLTFLAVAAISLALLVWLSLLLWVRGQAFEVLFPRLLVLPALGYLISVKRGELLLVPEQGNSEPPPSLAFTYELQHRWVVYAAAGLATVFMAAMAGSVVPIIIAAVVGGMSVMRLALQSGHLVRNSRTMTLFDNLLGELDAGTDPKAVMNRVSLVAREILGPDADVVVSGLAPGGKNDRTHRVNAVLSRSGHVQVRTGQPVSANQARAVRYLANLTELALGDNYLADYLDAEQHAADRTGGDKMGLSTSADNRSGPDDAYLQVEDGLIVACHGPVIRRLGYDPTNSDAQPYLDAAARGELVPHGLTSGRMLELHAYPGHDHGSELISVRDPVTTSDPTRTDIPSGLPNLLDFELQGHLENVVVTVFYLHDLDRVRDSVGADAGDSFVRRLVARVRRSFRENRDRLWRGDGSKLIVLSPIELRDAESRNAETRDAESGDSQSSIDREALLAIDHRGWIEARRVLLSTPTALGMSFIAPGISAGFVVVDKPTPATEALQRAEMALMYARANAPRTTVEYTAELHAGMAREWQIESYLAASLDGLGAAGFSVHYQPIVEASSGLVKVLEGLCRWDHPELGSVPPSEFIPIAERTGMIAQIDHFVLAQAISDVARFRDVDPDIVIQVNMSASGLKAERLSDTAKTILQRLGGRRPGIAIEITESALTSDSVDELAEVFTFLRDGEIGISLDDFGTGESNFERLSHLPFTQVKLADDFVRSNDLNLVSNVVKLVHGLGMKCVIEGVETEAHQELAIASGGDLIQGWVYAKAMPRHDALRFADARRQLILGPEAGNVGSIFESTRGSSAAPGRSILGADGKPVLFGLSDAAGDDHNEQADN